jgi:hypothetical protein
MSRFSSIPFLLITLFAVLLTSCSKDTVDPVSTTDPQKIDANCKLVKVYRDIPATSSSVVELYQNSGFGADTVKYLNHKDSSLIHYTTFIYNAAGKVLERKVFDNKKKIIYQTTIDYWPNGNAKLEKRERKNPETLYDQTNTYQETRYDEQGTMAEYKNFSSGRSLMNHLIFTNTYSDGRLQQSVRDDQLYHFDAITTYSYNSKNLLSKSVTKDTKGKITDQNEYVYNDKGQTIETKYYSGINLVQSEQYSLNNNGIMLKSEFKKENGTTYAIHHYAYNCK